MQSERRKESRVDDPSGLPESESELEELETTEEDKNAGEEVDMFSDLYADEKGEIDEES